MSVLGRPEDRDPLDYSRMLIAQTADRLGMYAGMLQACIEDRDDDGAHTILRRVRALEGALETQFKALAAGRAMQPHRDAASYFQRIVDAPVTQP